MTNNHFETLCLHSGYDPESDTHNSFKPPIYQTSSYTFTFPSDAANLFALKKFGNIYSRLTNPTVSVLAARLAAMEDGVGAVCTSSGHSAQLVALLNLMQTGDHIVVSKALYGGSITQFGKTFKQFGWNADFVDTNIIDEVKAAVKDNTKAIFIESISNPSGMIADIEVIAEIAHDAGIPLIVDNTIPTSYLCRPFEHGADIVTYSTTKFLTGNGSIIGGSIVDSGKFDWSQNDKFPLLTSPDQSYNNLVFNETFGEMAFTVRGIAVGLRDLGACLSPFNAYLAINGIETLSLRMDKHSSNGLKVAQFLEKHPKVNWVSYPGLESNKYYSRVKKYCPKGSSSVFSFSIQGNEVSGKKLVESLKLISHLANVGDARSLIIHPYSTTHSQLSDEQKIKAGVLSDVIRISIGIEHPDDLIADLSQALAQV